MPYTTLILVLILIIVVVYLVNPAYLSSGNIMTILYACTLSGMLACGVCLVMISGNMDLSTGAIGALGGIVVALLCKQMHWIPATLIALAVGVACGAFNAMLINVFNFMPFIATLATASVFEGLEYILSDAKTISISQKGFFALGTGTILKIPVPVVLLIIMLIIYGCILNYTKFGRYLFMCGGNRNAARLAGINPKKLAWIVYINCGAISSFAGVVLTARMHAGAPTNVLGAQFKGITAAILGGVAFGGGSGGMGGVLIGLLIMNCFNNGLTVMGVASYTQVCAEGALLIIALLVDYFRQQARIKAHLV